MVQDSKRISDVSVSETSNGRATLHLWKGNGYDDTYQMDRDTAAFLFNRLGAMLGRLPKE